VQRSPGVQSGRGKMVDSSPLLMPTSAKQVRGDGFARVVASRSCLEHDLSLWRETLPAAASNPQQQTCQDCVADCSYLSAGSIISFQSHCTCNHCCKLCCAQWSCLQPLLHLQLSSLNLHACTKLTSTPCHALTVTLTGLTVP
jgi:hypothetical protein